jgi:hypothetical protein
VAQHSVLVAENLPPPLRLAGLLHDAAEAYVGDVIAPLKKYIDEAAAAWGLVSDYTALERKVHDAIAAKFGLPTGFQHSPEVKHADLRALHTECRDLMIPSVEHRGWVANLPPPFEQRIVPWPCAVARERFLAMMDTRLR